MYKRQTGILPGHIPMTNILKPGILKLYNGNTVKYAALHEGFVEILQDKVTILAETAEWPDEIDVDRAREAEERDVYKRQVFQFITLFECTL